MLVKSENYVTKIAVLACLFNMSITIEAGAGLCKYNDIVRSLIRDHMGPVVIPWSPGNNYKVTRECGQQGLDH